MEKKYIFQCALCKNWGKGESAVRTWEKQVPYDKGLDDIDVLKGKAEEKEGELVLCKQCYKKLK